MKKEFQPPKKKQPIWKPVSTFLKLFYKKPTIINLNDHMPQDAILVANHSAMSGPMIYSLHLPVFHVTWGAHPMLGTYHDRFHYLRDVYFVQKRGMRKCWATIIAGFEAAFSVFFYRGVKTLPTYTDAHFVSTIKNSITCLDNHVSVMIFPEDSSDGYHEKLKSFLPGFVLLAERYRKTHGKDVEIYPLYYHSKKRLLVIGKPAVLANYPNATRQEIADQLCAQVNDLFEKHIKNAPNYKQRKKQHK